MLFEDLKCLRCGNEIFEEIDGWMKKWFIDVDFWQEIESAKEYK